MRAVALTSTSTNLAMKNALIILAASLCLAPVAQFTPRTVNIKEIV